MFDEVGLKAAEVTRNVLDAVPNLRHLASSEAGETVLLKLSKVLLPAKPRDKLSSLLTVSAKYDKVSDLEGKVALLTVRVVVL